MGKTGRDVLGVLSSSVEGGGSDVDISSGDISSGGFVEDGPGAIEFAEHLRELGIDPLEISRGILSDTGNDKSVMARVELLKTIIGQMYKRPLKEQRVHSKNDNTNIVVMMRDGERRDAGRWSRKRSSAFKAFESDTLSREERLELSSDSSVIGVSGGNDKASKVRVSNSGRRHKGLL